MSLGVNGFYRFIPFGLTDFWLITTWQVGLWRLSLWLLTDMLIHSGSGTIQDTSPNITQSLLQLEFKTALGRYAAT